MNPFGLFCIGRSEFGFHLDGELNRDGWHRFCMPHMMQLLLEMAKPYNDMFFISFVYFDCTENTVRLWIRRMKWKINIFSISFTLVLPTETEEEYEELVRRIHFCDFGRRNFDWRWSEKFSLILSLDDERVQHSEGIQSYRCQQIWRRHHGTCFWCLKCFNVFHEQTNHFLM